MQYGSLWLRCSAFVQQSCRREPVIKNSSKKIGQSGPDAQGLTRARAHAKPCGTLHERLVGRCASSIACEMSGSWPSARWAMIRDPFSLLPRWVLLRGSHMDLEESLHHHAGARCSAFEFSSILEPITLLFESNCRAKITLLHRVALEYVARCARA